MPSLCRLGPLFLPLVENSLPDEALFPREKGLEGVHLPRAYRFLCQPVGLIVSGIVAMPWHSVEANWDPSRFHFGGCLQYGSDDSLVGLVGRVTNRL